MPNDQTTKEMPGSGCPICGALAHDYCELQHCEWEQLGVESAVAERIAAALLTNGAGETAQRLVLELPDGSDGGGWCRAAIVQVVERELANAR